MPTPPAVVATPEAPTTLPEQTIVTASAPPAAPLTPEERKKRLRALRQRMGKSQIEVTPPAGKAGYWGPKDDSKELGRLDWLGFKIVHDDPKKPAWRANGMKEDGTYVIGDVILMEIDELQYELIQQSHLEHHEQMMLNTKDEFLSTAESSGVPAFEVAKPGVRKA